MAMRRRDFIVGFGVVAASLLSSPLAARAQQATPVVGILNSGGPNPYGGMNKALVQGMGDAGFIEGRHIRVEERFANGQYERVAELAAELARIPVAVLAVPAGDAAALAAKKTVPATVPIVFIVGGDPIRAGLVSSLNRPGGNATGVNIFTSVLAAKRLELLRDLVPKGKLFGALVNPDNANAQVDTRNLSESSRTLGQEVLILQARTAEDIDRAFVSFAEQHKVAAVMVNSDPYFLNQRDQMAALAARYFLPAIYSVREHVVAGGLISYGIDLTHAYYQVGVVAGRILKGEKVSDIPVEQPTKFQMVLNLKTARALGLEVPESIVVRTNEVLE